MLRISINVSGVLQELYNLQGRIKQLEKENQDLRKRLDSVYAFIHNTGNASYAPQDWDGVMKTGTESTTTSNSERLQLLTSKFGIDEYPLE